VILSISDIRIKSERWKNTKIMSVYLIVSIICIVVDKIYATFGHGVSSDTMTWMFVYPLVGGILFFFLRGSIIFRSKRSSEYRAFCNIYNTGIAMLTVGSFLRGIMDIAGTSSKYVVIYYLIGWCCIVCSSILILTLRTVHNNRKSHDIV